MKTNRLSRIKWSLVLCFSIALLLCSHAARAAVPCGENITYTIQNGILRISGTGEMEAAPIRFDNDEETFWRSPWWKERNSISGVVIEEGITGISRYAFCGLGIRSAVISDTVTSIGTGAFEECASLPAVAIPESVTVIYAEAFAGCKALTEIVIPDSVTSFGTGMFKDCTALESVTLPDGLLIVEGSTFSGCKALKGVSIPDGVRVIREYAFSGCKALESITIPDSVRSIREYAFSGCAALDAVAVPDSVTEIGKAAFQDCTALESAVLPSGLTGIPAKLFYNCSALAGAPIPDSVTDIGDSAFANCAALGGISIPAGVTGIGERAFSGCAAPSSIVIPDSMTSIGSYAFYGFSGMTDVAIPDSVVSVGTRAFSGCTGLTELVIPQSVTVLPIDLVSGSTNLRSITIPDTVTAIGAQCFQDCASLEEISIPQGVKELLGNTFSGCSALRSITIPDGVTDIGGDCFSGCASLEEIVIPQSVVSIGTCAFRNCSGLTAVAVPDTVTSLGDKLFLGCSGLEEAVLPSHMADIPLQMFQGCSSLASFAVPQGAAAIGDFAFSGCSSLASVSIPASVKSIGKSAFSGCSALTGANLPAGITCIRESTFFGCSGLRGIDIPGSVSVIEESAFQGCSGLNSIVIPDSVTVLGKSAFSGCSSLSSAAIGKGLTEIPECAFTDCSGLKSAAIPAGIVQIGNNAFSGCAGLQGVTIPGTVTSIGMYAFADCTSIKAVSIPDSVTGVSDYAFSGCISLSEITVPGSMEYIPACCFSGCTGLTEVTLQEGVQAIGGRAFANCTGLSTIHFPVSMTFISQAAFYGCSAIQNVFYAGTQEDWEGISIGDINEELGAAQMHYGHEHKWGSPEYQWSDDFQSCTASITCLNNSQHRIVQAADCVNAVTTEATCEDEGVTVYTAHFEDAVFGTPTQSITTAPALGHDWGEAVYTWSDDYKHVTGSHTCTRDPSHAETETVGVCLDEWLEDPTCTKKGKMGYLSDMFQNEWFTAQYIVAENIDMLPHTPVAIRGKAATCTAEGLTEGTVCEYCGTVLTPQETVPALGHDWGQAEYAWSDDHSLVTASRSCRRDAAHFETETAGTRRTVLKEATEDEEGLEEYSAQFTNPAFEPQSKAVPLPKLEPSETEILLVKKGKNGTFQVPLGDTVRVVARYAEEAGYTGVTFTSSKKSVAAVDATGLLTLKGAGKTTITAAAKNGKKKVKATAVLTVIDPAVPVSISIDQGASAEIFLGRASEPLTVTALPLGSADASVTWKSSDRKTVSVDSEGNLSGLKAGTAKITATSVKNKKVKATIRVTVTDLTVPVGVRISPDPATVEVGKSLQLSAQLLRRDPDIIAASPVTWKSTNKKIARVSKTGLVTGVKKGIVTITATAARGRQIGIIYLAVLPAPGKPADSAIVPQVPEADGEPIPEAEAAPEPDASPDPEQALLPPNEEPFADEAPSAGAPDHDWYG
ncbi:MAG: leucine-rich repeat protein [Clostridia bacterium]|nr:leucine-rich repeat protein [Clostridia bacterium]